MKTLTGVLIFCALNLYAQDTTKVDSILVKFETDLTETVKQKKQLDEMIKQYTDAKKRLEGIELYLREQIKQRKAKK